MAKEGNRKSKEEVSQGDANLNLLREALKTLEDIKPIVDEVKLRKVKQSLDTSLFTWFNLGQRKGKSREIEPCIASLRLYSGLQALRVPIAHQVRIIEELSQATEGVYRRATHTPFVPESTMQLAAKMWVYSTLAFATVDKFRGRLK